MERFHAPHGPGTHAARRVTTGSSNCHGQLGVRGGASCACREPASDSEKIPRVDAARVELKRHPHVGLRIELFSVEFGRQDSDDDVRHVAQRDTTAKDRRVILEPSRPQRIAQDGDQRAARPVFCRSKRTTGQDRRTKKPKEFGGDARNSNLFWFASLG